MAHRIRQIRPHVPVAEGASMPAHFFRRIYKIIRINANRNHSIFALLTRVIPIPLSSINTVDSGEFRNLT